MDYYPEILTKAGLKLLPRLNHIPGLSDFYLVGGTALSLYLGHRKSIDFDFFTRKSFPATYIEEFRKLKENNFQVLIRNDSSLEFILDGVKIFIWENHYPLIKPLNIFQGINIASAIDIGLLKLIAIQGRTTWKYIVDLYYIDQRVTSLNELLDIYFETYPDNTENIYKSIIKHHNLKELNTSPKPKMLVEINFEKAYAQVIEKLMAAIQAKLV